MEKNLQKINTKVIYQGAESIITLEGKIIKKERISKSYRNKILDQKIISSRTKRETKLLLKASKITNTPEPLGTKEENIILLPYIKGQKLSKDLNKFSLKKQKKICYKIGKEIAKLHEHDIIHSDLTTSNMILKNNKIYLIDFGLGFVSKKIEDKAVDLHLFNQALESKHYKNSKKNFDQFLKGYSSYNLADKVINRLKIVQRRGRYRH